MKKPLSTPAMSRRAAIGAGLGSLILPRQAIAAVPDEITWDDLIPPGIPYAEIVGEGDIDLENDTWAPEFDANGYKMNERLDGAFVKLPGFIIPLEFDGDGVTDFILVPYVGACIHVPPPPPNQLVFVSSKQTWPNDSLWDAVWVIGHMSTKLQDTELAETGYALEAERMEIYVW